MSWQGAHQSVALATFGVAPQPSWNPIVDLEQVLEFHFMVNALLAGAIVAVVAGVIGYFMVLRGQSFAGHTLSQVGFPGAAGSALLGLPALAGLLAFCVVAALGINALGDGRQQQRRAESAHVGTVLAMALALGALFTHLYPGYVTGVYTILFGSLYGVTDGQVLALGAGAVLVLAVMAGIGRPLLFASVDADVAAARGVPVRALAAIFLLLLALVAASAATVIGVLLVFALLVTPAATAALISNGPRTAMLLAIALAVTAVCLGAVIAYFLPYPALGFVVTSLSFGGYLLARAMRSLGSVWHRHSKSSAATS